MKEAKGGTHQPADSSTTTVSERPSARPGAGSSPLPWTDQTRQVDGRLTGVDDHATPNLTPDPPPRYQVIVELGRGGMGKVEKVFDRHTGQMVARKRLDLRTNQRSQHGKLLGLFQREFHVLSQINHPRIVRVYDYGRDSEGPYYTMELLGGSDLHALGKLPWRKACQLARDVASSLAIIHGRRWVHRDVTPRNIRVDSDGHAKLLDFGAMAPMGMHVSLVGTPPFIAPEAMQQLGIDGRTDLFALGATLYFCLTGRHAYPAHSVSELDVTWRTAPPQPSQFDPDIPVGLDALVMELLEVSPVARPQNAAIVFERLVSIACLKRDEALDVSHAYLTSSSLVGRSETVAQCRQAMLAALRGRGRGLSISGAPGTGRTRMIESILIDAKMLGAVAIRAVDHDSHAPYGVLRQLTVDLCAAAPTSGPLSPALQSLADGGPIDNNQRSVTLRAFGDRLLECAKAQALVVVVDNLDRVDEPSQASLAEIAGRCRDSRLFIVATRRPVAPNSDSPALRFFQENTSHAQIDNLNHAQVRHLLGGTFGEADNLDVVTNVLFRRARGNASATMQAAQTLVDAGVVRYRAGSWSLPQTPADVERVLARDLDLHQRLGAVSAGARKLALLLSLDVHGRMRPADCAALLGMAGELTLCGVVDELIAARVLEQAASGSAILEPSRRSEVASGYSEQEQRLAHQQLARWYRRSESDSACAHHAASAGDWSTARQLALAAPEAELRARWRHDHSALPTVIGIVEQRHQHDADAPDLLPLRCLLLGLALDMEDWTTVTQQGPATMAALSKRCGLDDYRRLDHLPDDVRLQRAISAAELRHAANVARCGLEPGSILDWLTALKRLPSAILSVATSAVLAVDAGLAAGIPDLGPLYGLSPAFPLVDRIRANIVATSYGRHGNQFQQLRAIEQTLTHGAPELDDSIRDSLQKFCRGFLQALEATIAGPDVLRNCKLTEQRSEKLAERERFAYYIAIGDVDRATASRRQLERLELQGGTAKFFPTTWQGEFSLHLLTHNVSGLQRCEHQASEVARGLPGWAPRVELARIAQAQCGASSTETIRRARRLLSSPQLDANDRKWAVYLITNALFEHNQNEACLEFIQSEIDRLGCTPRWDDGYLMIKARAQARLGMHAQARKNADLHAKSYREMQVGGVLLGRMHESCARVALLAGDQVRFAEQARLCADLYRRGFNPALTARYERLMRQARQMQVAVSSCLERAAEFADRTPVSNFRSSFRTEIGTHSEPSERFLRALSLVVAGTGADCSALYVATESGLRRRSCHGPGPMPPMADECASAFFVSQTLDTLSRLADTQPLPLADQLGLHLVQLDAAQIHFYLLATDTHADTLASGVLALIKTATLREPDQHALAALAELLLEEDGVVGRVVDCGRLD